MFKNNKWTYLRYELDAAFVDKFHKTNSKTNNQQKSLFYCLINDCDIAEKVEESIQNLTV